MGLMGSLEDLIQRNRQAAPFKNGGPTNSFPVDPNAARMSQQVLAPIQNRLNKVDQGRELARTAISGGLLTPPSDAEQQVMAQRALEALPIGAVDNVANRIGLQPALRLEDGKLLFGTTKDTHYSLAKQHGVDPYRVDDSVVAGFTSNGKDFFDRLKGMEYVQRKEPEIFQKLQKEYAVANPGLESSSYAKYKGYDQSEAIAAMEKDFGM